MKTLPGRFSLVLAATSFFPILPAMTGSMENPIQSSVDEKSAIQPQESSDLDQRPSHQEVAKMGSTEAGLHESEKDIPV